MTHPDSSAPCGGGAGSAQDEVLRETGRKIERLLGEVEAAAGPSTWSKVEELVRGLLALHREGLSRVLAWARATGSSEEEIERRIVDDELVSSLLLLHGLHPRPAFERARRALEELRPYLESQGASVEIEDVVAEQRLRLRVSGGDLGSTAGAIERALRRSVEQAAPELPEIEVEFPGVRRAPPKDLVQLRVKRA